MQITREMWDQMSDEDKWSAMYSCQLALECQTDSYNKLQNYIEYLHTGIDKLGQETNKVFTDNP